LFAGPEIRRPTAKNTPVSVGADRDGGVERNVTLTPGRTLI
jgi:hypothetical protein